MLDEPGIGDEILKAGNLADIIKSLGDSDRLKELAEEIEELIDELTDEEGNAADEETQEAVDTLGDIKDKIEDLFANAKPAPGQLDATTEFKGTWDQPNKVLLRWIPQIEWLPEEGYYLYRIINGNAVLVDSKMGTKEKVYQFTGLNLEFSPFIAEIYNDSVLDPVKLGNIGVSSIQQFNDMVFGSVILNSSMIKIEGGQAFEDQKEGKFIRPASIIDKVPEADLFNNSTIHLVTQINTPVMSIADAMKPAESTVSPLVPQIPQLTLAEETVQLVLDARNSMLTLANTDSEFAEAVGFGYEDDFGNQTYDVNTVIEYVLLPLTEGASAPSPQEIISESSREGMYSTKVSYGAETPLEVPENLQGYGVDGEVHLRWQAPTTEYGNSIISGFYIERKKNGETEFTRLNDIPVAISFMEDENHILYEVPDYYIDYDVENGDRVTYRVQALDIFGRLSDYTSSPLSIDVVKTTPPGSPEVDQPVMSDSVKHRTESFFTEAIEAYSGTKGVILPISKTTDDTEKFIIYRSTAWGNGLFSQPVEVGRVEIPAEKPADKLVLKGGGVPGGNIILQKDAQGSEIEAVFFDANVTPGYFYKYWASAVDGWGNESAWSHSKVLGYSTDAQPQLPGSATASLTLNMLPDFSAEAVGFMQGRFADIEMAADIKWGSTPIEGGYEPRAGVDTTVVQEALVKDVSIGVSVSDIVRKGVTALPQMLNLFYGNMPEPADVHDIIALRESDIRPNGTADVSWYHYSGEGLGAYNVYRTYIDGGDIDEIRAMPIEEILEAYDWTLVEGNITYNKIIDTVQKQSGRIYLYMISMVPAETKPDLDIGYTGYVPGGWISLKWDRPDDAQISYFNVYKAEVPYFSASDDPDALDWTLVGDKLKYTGYVEEADQTIAHYYYFKITSVSVWGVETEGYTLASIRVASTVPPQAPFMLIPFPKKASVEVRWNGVPFASKYKVFRTMVPRVTEEDISSIQLRAPEMFNKIFMPEISTQIYMPDLKIIPFSSDRPEYGMMAGGITLPAATVSEAVSNFNTLQLLAPMTVMNSIKTSPVDTKVDVFKNIVEKYGVLAVAPYGMLDSALAKLVIWDLVDEVDIPLGQVSTGTFSFVDTDVEFGDTYMYTVQAFNDDGLASERPEPVSVSPRKGEAFPPVTGVAAAIDSDTGQPEITWNKAKDPNLSVDESAEFIAGYIVYRSKAQNGEYYQASPLLTATGYIDNDADPAAVNWYKVKVVDTGGYTSEFSSAVSTGGLRSFLLPSSSIFRIYEQPQIIIPLIPFGEQQEQPADLTAGTAFILPPISFPPIIIAPVTLPASMKIAGFDVINVATTGTGSPKTGTGDLVIANKYTVPVNLTVTSWGSDGEITNGSLSLKSAVQVGNTGVYMSALSINTEINKGLATGYVVKAGSQPTENLMGDLYSLRFNNSEITPGGIISITEIPEFRYDNILLTGMEKITLNLGAFDATAPAVIQSETIRKRGTILYLSFGTGFINMMNGVAENNLGMETIDNKGLEFSYSIINFDKNGAMNGTMSISQWQLMRTVIPAGLGISTTDAKLVYKNGVPDTTASYLKGKIMLPFETFVDDSPVSASFDTIAMQTLGDSVFDSSNVGGLLQMNPNLIKSGATQVGQVQKNIVDVGMFYLAERAQLQTLLIMPTELSGLPTISSIPIDITGWSGRGFIVYNKSLMPTLVGNDDEEVGVIGSNVTIDLDRGQTTSDAMTTETQEAVWTGMIIKSGRVSLPPAYIKTESNKRVSFNLTPGEMLYDRNGFYYQSQAYSPEGIPVNLGDQLGGFQDAYANSIYIDLYNNSVNLEIKGSIGIPLFGFQRANIRLYTSEELGKLVCTVEETEKFDPAGTGEVFIKISGGHLMEDGLHMDGTLDLSFNGSIMMSDIAFTELIVPADMGMLREANNPEGLLGSALFDKPYKIKFHDFDMEIRALSLITRGSSYSVAMLAPNLGTGIRRTLKWSGITMPVSGSVSFYSSDMYLWGGMQLSDTLSVDTQEDFDRIIIAGVFENPGINYSESKSKVNMDFEEFAQIDSVASPKVVDPNSGIIEYETDSLEMVFNTAADIFGAVEIECNARLGYDKVMGRYFFALAIYYSDPMGGIDFGYGKINDITGVFGYNLDIEYSEETGYVIPAGKQGLFNAIDTMDVNRTPGGNYFFAATAWMTLGYETSYGKLKLGEVRNLYLVVEKGPSVEIGGQYYGPSKVTSVMTGNDLRLMGTVRIGYYHRDKLFKFSLTLTDFGMYGLVLNGDVGFEMSPSYWELRIGYPNPLEARMGSLSKAGFGLVIKNTTPPSENFVKGKMYFEYDTGYVTIAIVYFRAYLKIGGEGEYDFNEDHLLLSAYIQGGLEGGIKVGGKRYEIISLHLNAQGELEKKDNDWRLEAQVKIRYHLSLVFFDVGGSVTWHMKLSF
ncbi:MAG: hypothetical protein JXB33_10690 [Clostridia bacterium]|nr:hypothetical protein [Clostridia bacterium]